MRAIRVQMMVWVGLWLVVAGAVGAGVSGQRWAWIAAALAIALAADLREALDRVSGREVRRHWR